MLNIILTFDYEIFFGQNYVTEKEVLIDPTYTIIDLLNKFKIQGTFFADICSIDAYKRERASSNYPELFCSQLKNVNRMGHDVQLHIHPHWIYAKYNHEWIFMDEEYRIHHFLNEDNNIDARKIIERGIDKLNDILKPINKDYCCYAFRAGGYCLQPEKELLRILANYGIQLDSSVVFNKKMSTKTHYFNYKHDYKNINWNIGSGVYEIPIGSSKNSLLKRLIPNTGYSPLTKENVRGVGIGGTIVKRNLISRIIKHNSVYSDFSLETMHYKRLILGLQDYYNKYNCKQHDGYLAINCHPKSMDAISIKNMETFLCIAKKNSDWLRFSNLSEARAELKSKI